MKNQCPVPRRDFLSALGLSAGSGLAMWPGLTETILHANSPDDLRRELRPSGADLGTLYPDVEKLVDGDRYSLSFLNERFRDLEDFKKTARQKVFELLLYSPAKVDPRAEQLERVDRGDHVREKVVFSTGPHFRVPAYILIPKKLAKPAPAIVDLHSHGGMFLFGKEKVIDLGDNHPAMNVYHERNYDGRPTATALVKRGYVVISIDALFFGERRLLMDADLAQGWDRSKYSLDDVKKLNLQCRSKEETLVKGLIFAGLSWPGIVFWDDMRTVDYLVTRPEVDPARIGCLGISMGGYRTIYLAGLDERIKAACITGFMSSVGQMRRAHLDKHSWVHFLPGLHRYLDLPDIASMAAPRALMVQQCSQDGLFPLAGMKESVEKIGRVYAKAGVPEKFAGRFYERPHLFAKELQEEAFAWFDRELKH
jgi:dienelactone hydrolase